MKVLFDYQAFQMQKFGGVSNCFCKLLSNFNNDITFNIGIVQSDNIHLWQSNLCPNLEKINIDIHKFIAKYKFKGKGLFYIWRNKLLPINTAENLNRRRSIELLKKGDFDIFHPTFFDDYFLKYLNGRPFVLTIHDMMPELFPEYYSKNDFQILAKRKLSKQAAAIIAVSENTKNDIVKILGISPEKIHVIYHGGPKIESLKGDSIYEFPYFLYVGQRNTYKNFSQLLIDFSKFISFHKEIKLVCTGPQFNAKEKGLISTYKLKNNVIHTEASDEQLKKLYANAIAFIYPSLYEGFGMPILEAFAYGCPVLLNNKSCFPEIAGDAAIYFDSDSNNSNIYETLETFYHLSDSEIEELRNKGYKQLSLYSWEKSALKLQELYESIANRK